MRENKVRKRKLSEEVRLRLLDLINSGTIGPGGALPSERELMERLGVGRPAIREAMQSLEGLGLIQIRHGGRARVTEPSVGRMVEQVSETMKHVLVNSPASLENLKEARALFEREMARIAAKRRSASDVERLEGIAAAQERAVEDRANSAVWTGVSTARSRRSAAIRSSPPWSMRCSGGCRTSMWTWCRCRGWSG